MNKTLSNSFDLATINRCKHFKIYILNFWVRILSNFHFLFCQKDMFSEKKSVPKMLAQMEKKLTINKKADTST